MFSFSSPPTKHTSIDLEKLKSLKCESQKEESSNAKSLIPTTAFLIPVSLNIDEPAHTGETGRLEGSPETEFLSKSAPVTPSSPWVQEIEELAWDEAADDLFIGSEH